MSWYYVENGQQAGPVSEAELEALVASGRVAPDTLVWREGMENWTPYSQTGAGRTAVAEMPTIQLGKISPGMGVQTPAPGGGLVQCTECGRYFGEDEVIRLNNPSGYGTSTVCTHCKPAFLQRIKEGGRTYSGTMDYAGFWIRVVAKILDGLIGGVCGAIIGAVVGAVMGQNDGAILLSQLLGIAFGLWYYIYFHGKFGATPGKMALKLRVVRADGSPLNFSTAGLRYLADILSGLILLIGYIMVAFDDEKRGLHDRLCETRVIRV